MPGLDLRRWTPRAVDEECRGDYARYNSKLEREYSAWFAGHPGRGTRWVAHSPADALPDGWAHLADLIPESERHRWWLSAKSSQTLALSLLGPAVAGPEPGWAILARSLGPKGKDVGQVAKRPSLEHPVPRPLLREFGRKPTTFDLFIETDLMVIGAECKWTERGLGRCSCGVDACEIAACKGDVLKRDAYWKTAADAFGLPPRLVGQPCPIALSYQAVRNVAALDGLRGDLKALFVLIYDDNNPYFTGSGDWPGWAPLLTSTLGRPRADAVSFRALSWQELAPRVVADEGVRQWARERHGLPV